VWGGGEGEGRRRVQSIDRFKNCKKLRAHRGRELFCEFKIGEIAKNPRKGC